MAQGVSVSDIRVSVGAGHCNITSLATNRLICTPPLSHPGHGKVEGPDDAVMVEVSYDSATENFIKCDLSYQKNSQTLREARR